MSAKRNRGPKRVQRAPAGWRNVYAWWGMPEYYCGKFRPLCAGMISLLYVRLGGGR